MSTNYYVRPYDGDGGLGLEPDPDGDGIHLGKSSVGWTFTFRAYPAVGVTGYASWLALLDLGGIYDEYGRQVTRDDLLALIENKRGGVDELHRDDFRDEMGNRFVAEYFC
jgi:hypothetical protein